MDSALSSRLYPIPWNAVAKTLADATLIMAFMDSDSIEERADGLSGGQRAEFKNSFWRSKYPVIKIAFRDIT